MPRKSPTRTRTAPIAVEMVTPELLAEWRWLRQNRRRKTDEWKRRWKQLYADIGIDWCDMAGPLEADKPEPLFSVARQPHRFETWKQGRAWRLALLAAEAVDEA